MAIIQSYKGNAKTINLRVKTAKIDEPYTPKKKKKKDDKTVRKVKLPSDKKSKGITIRVKRNEED